MMPFKCNLYVVIHFSSSNILLDGHMRGKVADFGLSKPMPPVPANKSYIKVTSFRGTRGYTADEYLDGEMSTKLDVFSFGVVSIIILCMG